MARSLFGKMLNSAAKAAEKAMKAAEKDRQRKAKLAEKERLRKLKEAEKKAKTIKSKVSKSSNLSVLSVFICPLIYISETL